MDPITVFRLEHPTSGKGPYQHFWGGRTKLGEVHTDPDHPPAYYGEGYICGCPTLSDLQTWFSGWWETLLDAGFVTRQYVSSFYIVLDHGLPQVAFVPDEEG